MPEMLILPDNGFAVLLDEAFFSKFAKLLNEAVNISTVYFVTDSEDAFKEMTDAITIKATYQLYRSYLDNFAIGGRRGD